MLKYFPKFNFSEIPIVLIKNAKSINFTALSIKNDENNVYLHLKDKYTLYQYIYYVWLVDVFLKKSNGKIVDWGGFAGQVTILLRSLGYDCENNCLYYSSQKKLFNKFKIPFRINNKNPKVLPYKNNSCLAVVSSGVLEHVHETNMSEKEAFEEIFRILKPGGYFFCWNLPRKWSITEFFSTLRKISNHPIKYHISQIKILAKSTGFKIVYLDQHGDVLISFPRRLVAKFLSPWNLFVLDYHISKIPIINFFSHHITFVLRKPLTK